MKLQTPRAHPLMGKMDFDPGRWRPMYYVVEITVPVALGGQGMGTIPLNSQPFIMTAINGKILGETSQDHALTGLSQDGQWDLEWRDEQSNYQSGPIGCDTMFGGSAAPWGGYLYPLPYPIPFAGNKTLTFRVTNRVARVLTSEATVFFVQICCIGIADWGTFTPSET